MPTDQQIADLERRVGRLEVLVRQLQGLNAPTPTVEVSGGQTPQP